VFSWKGKGEGAVQAEGSQAQPRIRPRKKKDVLAAFKKFVPKRSKIILPKIYS